MNRPPSEIIVRPGIDCAPESLLHLRAVRNQVRIIDVRPVPVVPAVRVPDPTPDPWALPHATQAAIDHRNRACEALTISLSVFDRPTGTYRRGRTIELRARVWAWMRENPVEGGQRLSFPEIAAATGTPAHTVVRDAVRRIREAVPA